MFTVETRWGVRVPMRDGVQVVADLYAPQTADSVPTIVVRTPYGRSSDGNVEQGRWFAARGYAVLVVDVRGRGDSDGAFMPYRNEGIDGYDVIEWAARQPWCDGNVGTLGGSYLGKVQWLTALTHPPHLKAMVPIVSPSDPFVEWPTGTPDLMHVCWQFLTADRAPQNINQVNWDEVYAHLPLISMDEAAGREMPLWKELFEHTQLDNWWAEQSYQGRFSEIDLPVLHISGWYDDEQIGTPLNFATNFNIGVTYTFSWPSTASTNSADFYSGTGFNTWSNVLDKTDVYEEYNGSFDMGQVQISGGTVNVDSVYVPKQVTFSVAVNH